jgi:hypothetical protein
MTKSTIRSNGMFRLLNPQNADPMKDSTQARYLTFIIAISVDMSLTNNGLMRI